MGDQRCKYLGRHVVCSIKHPHKQLGLFVTCSISWSAQQLLWQACCIQFLITNAASVMASMLHTPSHYKRSNCYGKRVAYSISLQTQQLLWQTCCIQHLITNAATAMASHAACSTYLGVCGLQHCHPLPFRIIHDLGKHESTTVVLLVNGSLDKYQSTQVWGLSERCSIVKAQVWSVFPYTQRWS